MNEDDFLDYKDSDGQAAFGRPAVTPYDFAGIPDLNFTNDPWAHSDDFTPATLPSGDIWDIQHSRADAPNTTYRAQKDINAPQHDEESTALHSLPYGLTQAELDSQLVQALESLEPIDTNSDAKVPSSDVIGPLEIVSTRTVWDTLTTVKIKRVTFARSNIEHEMFAILQAWQTRAKNQPSWTRPISMQTKKNRESIGPALFGWGRTDVPAWVEPPRTPKTPLPSQSSNVRQYAPERSSAEIEDELVEFGEFESAPPSAILQPPDNHFASDSPIQDQLKNNSARLDTDSGVCGLGIFDLGDFTPSSPEKKNIKQIENPVRLASEPLESRQQDNQDRLTGNSSSPYTAAPMAVVTTAAAAAPEAGATTGASYSNAADVWDLSIFEKQHLDEPSGVSSPVVSSIDTSAVMPILSNNTASGVSKNDGRPRQSSLSDTRASKEAADQQTVERITLLLPDIDYLLN